MSDISDVPEYYHPEFKGRKPKHCPNCESKMEYDGWGSDGEKIDEFWVCNECKKMFKNPE